MVLIAAILINFIVTAATTVVITKIFTANHLPSEEFSDEN